MYALFIQSIQLENAAFAEKNWHDFTMILLNDWHVLTLFLCYMIRSCFLNDALCEMYVLLAVSSLKIFSLRILLALSLLAISTVWLLLALSALLPFFGLEGECFGLEDQALALALASKIRPWPWPWPRGSRPWPWPWPRGFRPWPWPWPRGSRPWPWPWP